MPENSASGLVKNKLYVKPQRASKMQSIHVPIEVSDTSNDTTNGFVQNRIVVKHVTAFGL